MQKRKAGIVKKMTDGIMALFKAAGVTPSAGSRQAAAGQAGRSTRRTTARAVTLTAKHVVLASARRPSS